MTNVRIIHISAPCVPYPEESTTKSIPLGPCPDCRCDLCWLHYLRWEVKTGVTLNAAHHHLVASNVIVDPALVEPERKPGTTPRMYFLVDDGGMDYTVVATDRTHAEKLLGNAGLSFYNEDTGKDVPFAEATWLEWTEITPERAAEIRVFEDDGSKGPYPLNTFEPGDWFCSEY